MDQLLSPLAALVRSRPRLVLVAALVVTVVLGGFATRQSTDTELTSFSPDSATARALDRVGEEFGSGGESLQVIVDAGPGGNVWTRDGLLVAQAVIDAIAAHTGTHAERISSVSSFAAPVADLLAADGETVGSASDERLGAAIAEAMAGGNAALTSLDLDADEGRAEAGLVVVGFPPELTRGQVEHTSLVLAEGLGALGTEAITVSPFNAAVLNEELRQQSESEMSRLLGLSILLILAILFFQYRTVSDVAIGIAGLVAAIVWMMGIAVLLGPDFGGLVGPFTQIATIVPVLLVGLGIDYAIHVTSRYREERALGVAPDRSAAMAVRTVGGALGLATATTIVGFLTNLASPLPPMADFGVFIAVGVASAFVVMTAVVPAARNLLDTRRARRGRRAQVPRAASGLSRIVGRTAVLAERTPRLVLGAAATLTVVAAIAASQVSTTFSQDDFIPEGSRVDLLLDRMDEAFAGDVSETTFVLVHGDLTDPAALSAMARLPEDLAGIVGVRTNPGSAHVTTPLTILDDLAAAPEHRDRFAALGMSPDGGLAPDADVEGLFALAESIDGDRLAGTLSADRTTGLVAIGTNAGQDGAKRLAGDLDAALGPLEAAGLATSVTSELLVIDQVLDAMAASQTRGIAITLAAAMALLTGYFWWTARQPLLGVITMIPSLAVVTWVLGTMWLLGISFNVLTAMVASMGIGIGVPYGIHITHRFLEDRRRHDTVEDAIRSSVTHTGGAMAGSAATTACGFGVLVLASLTPMQQFGLIIALTITYSFLAAVLVQPACLRLWAQRQASLDDRGVLGGHERPHPAGRGGTRGPAP